MKKRGCYKTPQQRLSRYKISEAGCWEWQGALESGGYGHIAPLFGEIRAHRANYVLLRGPIPDGLLLLHSCDNRKCINPDHLRPGTYSDNQKDAYERGRRPIFNGSKSPNAKLTEQQATDILADPRKHATLAREYGVSATIISAIKIGRTWKHLQRAPS